MWAVFNYTTTLPEMFTVFSFDEQLPTENATFRKILDRFTRALRIKLLPSLTAFYKVAGKSQTQ